MLKLGDEAAVFEKLSEEACKDTKGLSGLSSNPNEVVFSIRMTMRL